MYKQDKMKKIRFIDVIKVIKCKTLFENSRKARYLQMLMR